ncbi:MAG TPA: pyrimidine-nucleoside phosphorylase [Pseudogracilibacillus sp.]|nr:pyrimidine-nucleoside phosphorylase [Pseudogracilibacillus sp.]
MRIYDIIKKKRDNYSLNETEINYVITNYVENNIPDYQISALLMAIYFNGMTVEESSMLTMAMVNSGERIDLSAISGIKVDKHSTGGVGDTTTIILAPLVASVGVAVAKMSGRGLGHTGGTLDKLESIPGFNIEITNDKFINLVNKANLAVIGQSDNLAPADKLLYSLRDVTATVDSIPLIASSIMSKKIASGADRLVLDVKTGRGAFMENIDDAKKLANLMVEIGNNVGIKTIATISSMEEPLGYAIGNALEVKEAILTLQGKGPKDLTELCLNLGSQMVLLAEKAANLQEARQLLEANLKNGKALSKFQTFIKNQSGDESVIAEPHKLVRAKNQYELLALKTGYIKEINANQIGNAAMLLGAGRQNKDSIINLAVGIVLHKKVGDFVNVDESILTIHSDDENIEQVKSLLLNNIIISEEKVERLPLIYEII